jgi:hypothetical protein
MQHMPDNPDRESEDNLIMDQENLVKELQH